MIKIASPIAIHTWQYQWRDWRTDYKMASNSLKRATAANIRATIFSRSHINAHLQSSVPNNRHPNVRKKSAINWYLIMHQSRLRSNSIENTISRCSDWSLTKPIRASWNSSVKISFTKTMCFGVLDQSLSLSNGTIYKATIVLYGNIWRVFFVPLQLTQMRISLLENS